MIRICHISTVHPLFDNRIFYKECLSLAEQHYEVHLVIPHDKDETISGVRVHPVPTYKNRLSRIILGNHHAFYRALSTKS
jgi:hypothetical protein